MVGATAALVAAVSVVPLSSGGVEIVSAVDFGPVVTQRDVGGLGGSYAGLYGVNDHGEAVGGAEDAAGNFVPIYWSEGTGVIQLDGLSSPTAYGFAARINDDGVIVGISSLANGTEVAVRWDNYQSSPVQLRPVQSGAQDVNELGTVAGFDGAAGWRITADNTFTALPFSPTGINNLDQTTGSYQQAGGANRLAYAEPDGTVVEAPADPALGSSSSGFAIGDGGHVVGRGDAGAVRWTIGVGVEGFPIASEWGQANDVNDLGQTAVVSRIDGTLRAHLWEIDESTVDLGHGWVSGVSDPSGTGTVTLVGEAANEPIVTALVWDVHYPAAPGGTGEWIAMEAEDGIQVVRPDGSDRRVVTADPAGDYGPAVSADGGQLAFYSYRNSGSDSDLYTIGLDGSALTPVTSGPDDDLNPAWSPDGALLAFESSRLAGSSYRIYVVRPDGTGLQPITAGTGYEWCADWSPDGTLVAFGRDGDIWTVHVASGVETQITSGANDSCPRWSPLGNAITFTRFTPNVPGGDILTVAPDGSSLVNLTNGVGGQLGTWSPDGARIAFTRGGDLLVMDRDGSSVAPIVTGISGLGVIDWYRVPSPGSVDSDGDGISDSIDLDPLNASDQFADGATTFGQVTLNTTGEPLTVLDLPDPGGVTLISGGTSGHVTLEVCGGFTIDLGADSEVNITCGSITIEVISGGPVDITPDGDGLTVVIVPVGVTAAISSTVNDDFVVQHLGGDQPIVVQADGNDSIVDEGETADFTSNVAPTIGSVVGPDGPINLADQPVSIIVEFDDPGVADTHTCDIDWGDGVTTASSASGTTCDSAHAYEAAGVYEISMTVTDNAGDSDTDRLLVVVYYPDGGFVTGGGWIDSPAGALIAEPTLAGRANFGFVSRYKKGATQPTGSTQFQFQVGDVKFESHEYDWLVVTGSDYGRFKGTGTVNGLGIYKFMVWARDASDDTFRIRIWDESETLYDNGMDQPISGGNIVVHNPN